jgi:signal peptidase I
MSKARRIGIALGAVMVVLAGLGAVMIAQLPRATLACAMQRVRVTPVVTYSIPVGSMSPTMIVGDYVAAQLCAFADRVPERGEIAVFKRPGGDEDYVKRIVGLPGDRVQMHGGILYLNDAPVPRERVGDYQLPTDGSKLALYRETLPGGRSYEIVEISDDDPLDNSGPVLVPAGNVFVLGDNRDRSSDSRSFGPVPLDRLEDRPFLIWWSRDRSRIGMNIR